jgi:hypothetical protein
MTFSTRPVWDYLAIGDIRVGVFHLPAPFYFIAVDEFFVQETVQVIVIPVLCIPRVDDRIPVGMYLDNNRRKRAEIVAVSITLTDFDVNGIALFEFHHSCLSHWTTKPL